MTRLPDPLSLSCPDGAGTSFRYGAHAASWAPTGHAPVLWMSSRAVLETGHPLRGGVPVCFPWFGPGRQGDMEPAHGFARTTQWRADGQGEDEQGSPWAQFRLCAEDVAEDLRALFPHPFEAQLRMTAGASLRLQLTVSNTGSEAFEMEEALHTYLHVGDVSRVTVEGLGGVSYYDKVTREQKTLHGSLTVAGETDAVFAHRGEVRVLDPVLGRELVIRKEGSDSTVVWNPWVDKAAAMTDFGDDEWASMLCVEAGNVMGSPVRLDPGESHVLAQSVEVRSLETTGS